MSHFVHKPSLLHFNLPVPDGTFEVNGEQLGFSTSQRDVHTGHSGMFVSPGDGRCSACRWFEVRIIRVSDPDDIGGTYVVHTFGGTIVPDEISFCRAYITSSPYEIVAVLRVTRNGHRFIPKASELALTQAAYWDEDIRNAYFAYAESNTSDAPKIA